MGGSGINKKRVFIVGLLVITALLVYFLFSSYYLKGKLIVTTSDPSAAINLVDDNKDKKIGTGKTSVRLKKGQYLVQAKKGESVTYTTVIIGSRKTVSVHLGISALKTPETVVEYATAHRIKANTDSSLTYLSAPNDQLFKYNPVSKQKARFLPDLYPVTQVDWLEDGSAIVSTENKPSVFIDSLGKMRNLELNLGSQSSNYSVSKKGNIAFVSNGNVMLKKEPFAPAETISKLLASGYNLSISRTGETIFISSDISGVHNTSNQKQLSNYLFGPLTPPRSTKVSTSKVITDSILNDNGQLLLYTTGSTVSLYNVASKKTDTALTPFRSLPVWLLGFANTTLIYAQGSSLWQLDTKTLVSKKLSSYNGSISPSSFTLSAEGNLFYYSTDPNVDGAGGDIYQLKLD